MLHADTGCAISSHRVPNQAAAHAIWNRPVMRVHIRQHIVRDEPLEIAKGHGTRVHGPVVQRLRVRQNYDHLLGAPGESAFDGLRHVDFVGPLLGADGVTMQVFLVTRRQENDDVAVDGVALQVPSRAAPWILMCSTVSGLAPGTTGGTCVCTWAVSGSPAATVRMSVITDFRQLFIVPPAR